MHRQVTEGAGGAALLRGKDENREANTAHRGVCLPVVGWGTKGPRGPVLQAVADTVIGRAQPITVTVPGGGAAVPVGACGAGAVTF